MNLTVYFMLHLPSCHRFFISYYCRYQILWTFHGGILFDSSNYIWYVFKFGCCYSTMSLFLPKSCLRLSYSLVVDCFNFFTSNKQRLCKKFVKSTTSSSGSQLQINGSAKSGILATFISGLVSLFFLPVVISSTKHDFKTFDILSSHSWRTVFLSFNFAAWLSDMVRNVWRSNFLFFSFC